MKILQIKFYCLLIRSLQKIAQRILAQLFLYPLYNLLTFDNVLHFNCNNKPLNNPERLDIVTIAFNNDMVIEHQVRLLNKYLLDPYHYTIADNSSDPAKQEKIMQIAKKTDISYIFLPKNPFTGIDPSLSHGSALNWIFRNYIKHRKAKFFGFIDHDIFPVQPTRVVDSLQENPVYGLIQERGDVWYLWPGFCFFQHDYTKDKKINFMPSKACDTGGGNWKSIYSELDKSKIPQLKHKYDQLRKGGVARSDWVEYIGDWLHTFNASGWFKIKNKDNLVDALLNKY